jgi:heat shock protein HspQ
MIPFQAKFSLSDIVRHRDGAFRGVVMDVDPAFAGEPSDGLPLELEQPFYRIYALGPQGGFVAYAAESALERDPEVMPLGDQARWFTMDARGRHAPLSQPIH